jgi:tagatose-1,6-bisphosphate aldolase non-catalytic subunit AgaZ/GatZ
MCDYPYGFATGYYARHQCKHHKYPVKRWHFLGIRYYWTEEGIRQARQTYRRELEHAKALGLSRYNARRYARFVTHDLLSD